VTTQVAKWGNSLAVRIPKEMAGKAGLEKGMEVKLTVSKGSLLLTPKARPKKYTLKGLAKGITPQNRHAETDWGAAAGGEIW
jgi:antitoxin MazE